ncbi:hypothetical protein ACLB2K_038544 [Fragaria x ananassa]
MAINGITSSTGQISIVIEDDSTDTTDVEALQDRMMNNLGGGSPFSDICCIFRVPQVLRRHNPKAYTPDVVSIGPFHRGGTPFQRMEKVKQCIYAMTFCYYKNRIPWFLLNCLYTLTLDPKDDPSLRKLMLTVFSSHHQLAHNCRSYLRHLNHNVHDEDDDDGKILHILDLIRTSIVFPFKDQFDLSFYDSETELMHHALALSEAGVSFRRASSTRSIMNIEFKDGTLAIPQLAIGELTDSLFRNLIAFEQCYPGHSHKITSYAVLMDNLIGSSKDMEFLCEKKIIDNWLSAEDASKFFVKLYYDTVLDKFYYGGLCSKLNKHYDHKWKMWREKFKRTCCSDPWKFLSLTAAFILLHLTLLQTIYTILQAYDKEINVEALENNISAKLHCDSPVSAKCCIFRVPQVIRRQNTKAYHPDVVAIGPFHDRGSKHFRPMENVKLWYLRNLLLRKNINLKTLIQGINVIEFEKHALEFYAEPLDHLNKNDFIEMMILDDVASDGDSIVNIELEDRVYNNFRPPFYSLKRQFLHPATSLSEAGVVFRMDSSDRNSIMNIEFEDGVFTIPPLVIGELTESLFRNLIAFEQCYHGCSHKVTSYVVLMDNLIASQKDMNLFCEKNIITTNWRSAELDAYQFFNKLYNDTSLKQFLYDGLCYQVNEHYQVAQDKKLQRMRRELRTTAQLKRNYLTWNVTSTSLWKVTSLIAASVLLGVTIVQTLRRNGNQTLFLASSSSATTYTHSCLIGDDRSFIFVEDAFADEKIGGVESKQPSSDLRSSKPEALAMRADLRTMAASDHSWSSSLGRTPSVFRRPVEFYRVINTTRK